MMKSGFLTTLVFYFISFLFIRIKHLRVLKIYKGDASGSTFFVISIFSSHPFYTMTDNEVKKLNITKDHGTTPSSQAKQSSKRARENEMEKKDRENGNATRPTKPIHRKKKSKLAFEVPHLNWLQHIKPGLMVNVDVIVLDPDVKHNGKRSRYARCVEVCDDTSRGIILCLGPTISKKHTFETHDIISLENVEVKIIGDMYKLVSVQATRIQRLDDSRVKELRSWLSRRLERKALDIVPMYHIRTIEDILRDMTDSGISLISFVTKGKVSIPANTLTYHDCTGRVSHPKRETSCCDRCDADTNASPITYVLELDVTVEETNVVMKAGDSVGTMLFEMAASDLKELAEEDEQEFESAITCVGWFTFTFRCLAEKRGDKIVYTIVKILQRE